ncbi:hypothetical protein D3C83_26530 [compost metagenome]
MRQVVERVADAGLRKDRAAQLAGDHQRGDAGDVRLQRDDLQVHHQLQMFLERGRHADRQLRQREVGARGRLGALDATLDLAYILEVLRQPPPIRRRKILLQRRDLSGHRIEQAPRFLAPRAPLGVGRADAEELLEHEPRVAEHRQRFGRRFP